MMLTATCSKTKPKGARRLSRDNPEGKRKKGPVRFPGIVADARTLGVHRVTLYRVLTGEFTHLPGLRRRYDALKREQTGAQ